MKRLVLALLLVGGGLVAGALGALTYSRWAGPAASEEARRLWTCSMHPQVLQDKPGTCPICGMKLVPLREEAAVARKVDAPAGPTVTIDPVLTQNIGVRVAPVEEGPLVLSIRTVGYLREAETQQQEISLKVAGWIERLHANTEGMFLRKGDPLFDLYSPDLLVAQEELILAHRTLSAPGPEDRFRSESTRLVESARQKLALWGVPKEAVEELLRSGKASPTVTFRSPSDGFVVEKAVVQGSAVEAGMKVLRIVDQSTLWIDAQVYEGQIPYVKLGQKARAAVRGRPEPAFDGTVVFLSPQVNPMTRTAVARIAFANPDLLLKPGLYATVELAVEVAARALLVPREAVIDTGLRQVAFVALEGGRFEPRLVRMGLETGDGRAQVLSGLAARERVVTSGQFLIDAESRMREAIQKMTGERLLKPPPTPLKASVDPVVTAYLEIARALAEDRAVSPAAVDALSEAARKAGHEDVARAAAGLRDSPIKQQREAFKALSEAVVNRVSQGTSGGDKLFVFRCDMAKARWLQAVPEPTNPYYGKAMSDCGELTATLRTGPP